MPRHEKIYICTQENCSASFSRPSRYEIHLRVHTGERPFLCSYDDCQKTFIRSCHLKRHEQTHESNVRCTVEGCSEVLKTRATLKKHIDVVHNNKKKTYNCSYCEKKFNKHNWLRMHEYKHTNIKPYVCPEEGCEKRFIYPCKLKVHAKIHKGYTCAKDGCGQVFPNWSLYVKHIKASHPISYNCPICEKKFSNTSNLLAHQEVHHVESTGFPCPVNNCPRFYLQKRNLSYHIKNRHDKAPYTCAEEGCFKMFQSESELKKHQKFHDPNVPLPSKKRKKNKKKPTFASRLSGQVETRKQKIVVRSEPKDSVESKEPELTSKSSTNNEACGSNFKCLIEDNKPVDSHLGAFELLNSVLNYTGENSDDPMQNDSTDFTEVENLGDTLSLLHCANERCDMPKVLNVIIDYAVNSALCQET